MCCLHEAKSILTLFWITISHPGWALQIFAGFGLLRFSQRLLQLGRNTKGTLLNGNTLKARKLIGRKSERAFTLTQSCQASKAKHLVTCILTLYDHNAVPQSTDLYLQPEVWSLSCPCSLTPWLQQRRNHTRGTQRVFVVLPRNSTHELQGHKARDHCTSLARWADLGSVTRDRAAAAQPRDQRPAANDPENYVALTWFLEPTQTKHLQLHCFNNSTLPLLQKRTLDSS